MNFIQFKELLEVPEVQLVSSAILDSPVSDEELEELIADEELSTEEDTHPEVEIPATPEVPPETTIPQEPIGTDTESYKSPEPIEVTPETVQTPPTEVVDPVQTIEEPSTTTEEPIIPSSTEESNTSKVELSQ